MTDEEVVAIVRTGKVDVFETIMRRYNQRLYRSVLFIVRNEPEAEDVVQEALVRAYTHLNQFEGKAKFSTWLTKIAIYEAYARVRDQKRAEGLDAVTVDMEQVRSHEDSPEQNVYGQELKSLLDIRTCPLIPASADPYAKCCASLHQPSCLLF